MNIKLVFLSLSEFSEIITYNKKLLAGQQTERAILNQI